MLRTIRKELILNRNVILMNGVIFLALLTFFATMDSEMPVKLYAGWSSLMLSFLPAVMVTREDKFKAMTLGCSLPVSRKTVVQARFALSGGLAFLGILAAFLLGGFFPTSTFQPGDLFAWGPVIIGLSGITIVLSILLPITLRFGMHGIFIFLVGSQVLGVVMLTLVNVMGSSVDKRAVDRIVGFFVRAHATLGATTFNLCLVAFLLSLLSVSYLVSVRVFENREL
jgi:hypothetical protein